MPKPHLHDKSIFFVSQAGCLLPFLIASNLLFGWMFFKFSIWLSIGMILILLFILSARIAMRKIFSSHTKRDNVIDVEGVVVKDEEKYVKNR